MGVRLVAGVEITVPLRRRLEIVPEKNLVYSYASCAYLPYQVDDISFLPTYDSR